MSDEFEGISGHAAWRAKLKSLLQEANAAAQQTQLKPRLDMADRLTRFVEQSVPNDGLIRSLDKIAEETAVSLMDQTIEERLKQIAARNARLAALTKEFDAAADAAREEASQLRLEALHQALTAVNDGLAAFRQLEKSLKSGDDAALAQAVTAATTATRQLRDALQART